MADKIDEMTASELAMVLEAKITHTIRTAKRTKNFKVYLDVLQATYKQSTALSDTLRAAEKMAMEDNEL
jgi:hypothetical protein